MTKYWLFTLLILLTVTGDNGSAGRKPRNGNRNRGKIIFTFCFGRF